MNNLTKTFFMGSAVLLLLWFVPDLTSGQQLQYIKFAPQSSAPVACTGNTGSLYYDSVDSKVKFCNGSTWANVDTTGTDTNNYTTGISFTGTGTKTLTLTRNGLTDLTANFTDLDTNSGGTITGVTAGTGLSGGGTSGNVTVSLNLGSANTWTAAQTINVIDAVGLTIGSDQAGLGRWVMAFNPTTNDRLYMGFSGTQGGSIQFYANGTSNGATQTFSANGDVSWSGSLTGGSVPWARLSSFPSACGAGTAVTAVGGTLTCSSFATSDTNNYPTGIAFSGTTTKTLTLNRNGLTDLTANFTDNDTNSGGTVTSITAGTGLSGGTITTSGTISLNLGSANTWTTSQRIQKTAHLAGASDYHLELYSEDTLDSNKEVSLRFHQGGRYWYQIRARSGGFRFTDGSTDTLTNITAATGSFSDVSCTDCIALSSETSGNYVAGLSAGTGIAISGTPGEGWSPTVTNTDLGSSQNIFKNIAVSGQTTVAADGNNDTLTFAAGSNVTLTTNATTDTVTIASIDTNSGGTITGVTAGNGLTGGGTSGSVTLNVGAGTGISVAADTVAINTGAALTWTAAQTFSAAGTDIIADKIDAGTIDPVYTIGGKRYATYMAAMTGVKEETTGVVNLTNSSNRSNKSNWSYEIDFNKIADGSDLWLFSRTTDFGNNWNNLTVLLTPSFGGQVWYEKNPAEGKLVIYGSRSGEVSYRLTAARFDWRNWTNYSDAEHEGFNLDKLLK